MININANRKTIITISVGITAFLFAMTPLLPPGPGPLQERSTEFSSSRAQKHIQAIAFAPHPVGSPEHAVVREYILRQLASLGLDSAVQENEIEFNKRGRPPTKITVRNIVAVIKGTGTSKAVMLAAHYDSAPDSPGASDNASGVATLLETARAILNGPPLRNNLLLLFADGEEVGLLGARTFMASNPWASSVGVVLNFDSRGCTGPVVMFETAGPADWLVHEVARSMPYPIATSLSADVYRHMPNSTDFTVFRNNGYIGLNFAFFVEPQHYHAVSDSIENLDPRSLQHEGLYAVSLARRFGNIDFPSTNETDTAYFNIGRSILICYSARWNIYLIAPAIMLLIGVATNGMRKGKATLTGLCFGTLAAATGILMTAACGLALEHWVGDFVRTHGVMLGVAYFAADSGVAVLMVSLAYRCVWDRTQMLDRMVPVYACWVLAGAGLLLPSPGASYLFAWPAIIALIPAVPFSFSGRQASIRPQTRLWLVAGALPALILFAPVLVMVHYAIRSLILSVIRMTCIALTVELVTPVLQPSHLAVIDSNASDQGLRRTGLVEVARVVGL